MGTKILLSILSFLVQKKEHFKNTELREWMSSINATHRTSGQFLCWRALIKALLLIPTLTFLQFFPIAFIRTSLTASASSCIELLDVLSSYLVIVRKFDVTVTK